MKNLLVAILLIAGVQLEAAVAPVPVSLGSLPQSFIAPGRLASDAAGNLYAADPQAGQVVVMDAFGRLVSAKSGLGIPLGIAIDSQGNIYLGDQKTGSVSVYNSQWTLLFQLGNGAGEFLLPNHIAVSTGLGGTTAYVSDSRSHQVKVYQGSKQAFVIGGYGGGNGQFIFPSGVCLSPAGVLYVVDQINDRVQVFDSSGNFLRLFPLQSPGVLGRAGRSQGIVADNQGAIYVVDNFQGLVRVFDEQGILISAVGGYGRGAGQLSLPVGIILDSQGRLFVASSGNSRVEVFGLNCFVQLSASLPNQTVRTGTNVSFSVTANCGGPYTYQWLKDKLPLVDGSRISGATNSTIRLTGVIIADSGSYSVSLTGANGTVTSPSTTLIVSATGFAEVTEVATDVEAPRDQTPYLLSTPRPDGDLVLSWDNPAFVLEIAFDVTGPWTTVPGGESPYIVPKASLDEVPAQFFRLRKVP